MLISGLQNLFQQYNSLNGTNLTQMLRFQGVSQTFTTVSGCLKVNMTYLDGRAGNSAYQFCPNGSITTWPSQWTNFTYFDYTS